jgi:hypothetical protein
MSAARVAAPAVLAIVLAGSAMGCAVQNAPAGALPTALESREEAYGAWAHLVVEAAPAPVAGELLAVAPDSLWVLEDGGVRAVATAAVVDGRLVVYNARHRVLAAETLLGMISTISNGVFLGLTAPMWIIGGTIATRRRSREPVLELPIRVWIRLEPFARWPQGLPPGIDRDTIHPNPEMVAPSRSDGEGAGPRDRRGNLPAPGHVPRG